MKILPSLASANPICLRDEMEALGSHDYLHFDVEDGNFVPNITFGMKTVKAAAAHWGKQWDAHLMVTNPMEYIQPLAAAGCCAAAFHWESAGYPLRVVNAIRKRGMKAGIALNPRTAAAVLEPYLSELDYVLIMTSEPDGAGDLFQKEMIKKVEWLAKKCGDSIEIIADGGIAAEEFGLLKAAKATGIVMGRAIFGSRDPYETIQKFKRL